MITGIINSIFAIGIIRPDAFRNKLKLRQPRPIRYFFFFLTMTALCFLKEQQVGVRGNQRLPYLMQNKASIARIEPFMKIVG